MRLRRKNRLAVLNSGTAPPLRPTTLILPPLPRSAIAWLKSAPPTLSTTRSTFLSAMAVATLLRRLASAGSKTKSAPSSFSLAPFCALRDRATTVRPIDLPSSTDATPTPPEAPVTNSTEPALGGAGGWLHCVSAWKAVRNTRGAPAMSSKDQPGGMGATLAAGTTVSSASVPHVVTPAWQRRMPTVSPGRTVATPVPTATTSPTPSRPRMWGMGGLAGYCACARKASAGFRAAYRIRSSTSPGPGRGSATSARRRFSTPDKESNNHARMETLSQSMWLPSASQMDYIGYCNRRGDNRMQRRHCLQTLAAAATL